jgi:hypothetical protein
MGTLNGGVIKIPSHHELGVALEQGECGIDLGAKLLLHFQLKMLERLNKGVEME